MILDLLFPTACLGCGRLGTYVCRACRGKIRPVSVQQCLYCHRDSFLGYTHYSCHRQHGIDGVISLYWYGPIIQRIVKAIKYRFVQKAMQDLLVGIEPAIVEPAMKIMDLHPRAIFQAVPLHPQRQLQRGFNQSDPLTAYLARPRGNAIITALSRIMETAPQAQQPSVAKRRQNVRGAFTVTEPAIIAGKTIIVVDDVITSGNTVMAVAEALKRGGADQVLAISLARG